MKNLVLRKHDLEHDTSYVREIEMLVDSMLNMQAYSIQFWKDVTIYGIDEAILYLKGSGCCKLDELPRLMDRVSEIKKVINEEGSIKAPELL